MEKKLTQISWFLNPKHKTEDGMKIIFSKDSCPACDRLKEELKDKNESYIELTVDKHFTRDDVRALFPQFKYFPIVMEASKIYDTQNRQQTIKKRNYKK